MDDEDDVYLFCYDLIRKGSSNVTIKEGFEGGCEFADFPDDLCDIAWMDSQERMEHVYENGNLIVNLIGYEYGFDYCVRVAKAKKKK